MKFYPMVMTKIVLPALSQLSSLSLWQEYKRMMTLESWSLDKLRHYQFTKLKEMITHAYAQVPFYRQRFRESGLRPEDIRNHEDILLLPPTTKENIMSNFPEGITAQGLDRRRWKYVASSGTTRQIMGIHDFRKANINWAAGLRSHKLAGNHDIGRKWMEIPPHMCTNICGIDDSGNNGGMFSKELFFNLLKLDLKSVGGHFYQYFHARRHGIYRRITLPSFGSEGTNIPDKALAAYIDRMRKYQPYLLEGLPLYLHALAKYLVRSGNLSPKVGVIKPFGGSMTPLMKQSIEKAFGCQVYDTYGCSEMGFIACDCSKHKGLHLFMDLYYIEVCRNGKLVSPGEIGKLYITDLENYAMPWIRYDIGDVGRYFVEDHGCGRKSLRIQVEGRVEDTLCNSEGQIFSSDQVFDFFHGLKEIDNFQLIEKSRGNFDLLCVPMNGVEINKERIAGEFRKTFDPKAFVKVYPVKTIKAEDGGKFRCIKSMSFKEI